MKRAYSSICLLFTSLTAGVPAYAAGADVSTLLRTQAGRLTGWVSADLDGDRHADLASVGASRRDGRAYLQDITLRFSAFGTSTITVRTSVLAERLTFRDLDGDADRDLILEAFNREAVAVLLNDGEGHFHQGELEDFRFQLSHRSPRSLESVEPEAPPTDTGECPNDEPLAVRFSVFWPDFVSTRLIGPLRAPRPIFQHFGASTRGPPVRR